MEDKKNPTVTIETDCGKMVLELYPQSAPNTVNNFLFLAGQGFYNGLTFHRIIKGFMVQGGDPSGTGTGGPNYTIAGEFKANGFPNEIKHTRGVISMARAQSYNSAGSQFFIMHDDAPHLDGQYTAFGKLTEGFDVLDKIASAKTGAYDKPLKTQSILSVAAETYGVSYPKPFTLKKF